MISEGTVLADRYEILSAIGQGAFGRVFKCQDRIMDKIVAVKLLSDDTGRAKARFHREARAAARLNHMNIVQIYDINEEGGQPFLVLEYCPQETLADWMERKGPVFPETALAVVRSICAGLSYAHRRGVLHRDVKPSNIIMAESDDGIIVPRVLDFGMAGFLAGDDQFLTETGMPLGSPAYMSPESVLGLKVDERADIYSVGCILFELITGSLPFEGDQAMQTMMMRTEQDAPAMRDFSGVEYCEPLEDFVRSCLARDIDERFSSFDEVIAALDKLVPPYLVHESSPAAPDENQVDTLVLPLPETYEGSAKTPDRVKTWTRIGILGFSMLVAISAVIFMILVDKRGPERASNIWRGRQTESRRAQRTTERSRSDSKSVAVEAQSKPGDDDVYTMRTRPFGLSEMSPVLNTYTRDGKRWAKVDGLFENKDLAKLLSAKNIVNLRLVSGDLTGPEAKVLLGLPLKALDLKQSFVNNRTIEYVSKIETLEELYMTRCVGVDAASLRLLSSLKNLSTLDLGNLKLKDADIVALADCKSLTNLNLRRCSELRGSTLDTLSGLKIKNLVLSRTGVDAGNLSKLKNLSSLESLDLDSLAINDRDLKELSGIKSLRRLVLSRTPLTGKALAILSRFKNLEEIELDHGPSFTEDEVNKFQRLNPHCRVVLVNQSGAQTESQF